MHLTHLSLTNYRNFSRLDIDVPAGSLILAGDNAQGKTSLLESIYFLATMESFHAGHDRQLINFLATKEPQAFARMVGTYYRGSEKHQLEVRLIQEPAGYNGTARLKKDVLLDGVKGKLSDVIGSFNAVLFLPQMMAVIEGAPEERRRYLNIAMAQVIGYYPRALTAYHRALTQRNALLKQLSERGGDASQLDFWDEELTGAGAQIIFARIRAVQELELQAARIHRELTRGDEILRLCYTPSYDPLPAPQGQFAMHIDTPVDRSRIPLDQIQAGFREKLIKSRAEEIARGVTVTGPHRDELRFLSNGIDLGTYGSRGQVRTTMLALKLAEVAWMKGKTGHWPVLLLDEVLAELDTRRREDLLDRLSGCEQVLMTTTDLDLFNPKFTEASKVWRIEGGRIVQ
ncbi:MAG: DNA replication/repair protein RecF [Chloroflexi bacterium]|nr:MAG: DNA replication/repair protein RecF [Chloroflexota bacterium]